LVRTVAAHKLRQRVSQLVIRPSGKTRLCLPADYANDKLRFWNQEKEEDGWWNHWRAMTTNYGQEAMGVGMLIINSGDEVGFIRADYYPWRHNKLYGHTSKNNWQHDKSAHKFSFEFYLDNDLEETTDFSGYTEGADGSPLIYDDDESFWSPYRGGTGSYDITISEETTEVKKGASSLKMEVISGSYEDVGVYHSYASAQDWSPYDFICIWIYGANTGLTIRVRIFAPDASNNFLFNVTDNFTGWKRLVIPLRSFTEEGSPSWSNVTRIHIYYNDVNQTFTSYLDRTVVDVCNKAYLEVFLPDALAKAIKEGDYWYFGKVYTWNPSTSDYELRAYVGDEKSTFCMGEGYFLDGTTVSDIFGGWSYGYQQILTFYTGFRGETKSCRNNYDTITYSNYYGVKRRFGIRLKMPPDDGQDSSTDGISQVKLKLEIFYSEDESRRVVRDSSGYGNDGIVYGATPVDSERGKALSFDGEDDYVEVPDSPSLHVLSGDHSFFCWVKAREFPDLNNHIFGKFPSGENPGVIFRVKDTRKLNVQMFDAAGNLVTNFIGNITLETDRWYFVGYVKSGLDLTYYVNGEVDASGTLSANAGDNTAPIWIGRAQHSPDGEKWHGCLDTLLLYNRALSEEEIQTLYNGGEVTDGLVLHLKFDEEIYYGSTTYEFEDSTNTYYGLRNINEQWLALFDTNGDELIYYCFDRRPTGLTITADENEYIRETVITFPAPTWVWKGYIRGFDFTDSDGNGVPDIFETLLPWLPDLVHSEEVVTTS